MKSIHEIPLVGIAIPFGLGILIGDSFSARSNLCLLVLALLLVVVFATKFLPYKIHTHSFYFLSFIVLLLAGTTYINIINERASSKPIPTYQEYSYEGYVSNVKTNEEKVNCEFSISKYASQDSTFALNFKAQLYISNADIEIKDGDRLVVLGTLFPTKANTNPNTFDYSEYLRHKYINHQISISSQEILSHEVSTGLWHLPVRLNNYVQSILKKYACCKENAGVAIGMITGNKNDVPQELLDTYSKVGTMHLLAVSGLHVGIISGFLLMLFSLKKNTSRNPIAIAIIIITIWAFVLFTGAKASTVRAGVMFSLLLSSILFRGIYNTYNVIACSALLILLIDPHSIFDLGFRLSYLAVISIIFFYPLIHELIPYRNLNKLSQKTWSLACISLSANILIIPISTFYFNQISLSFIFSNLIAVPMAAGIVIGGFALIVFDLISSTLCALFAKIYFIAISFMNWILQLIEQIPYLLIENVELDQAQIMIAYALMISVMIYFTKKKIEALRCPIIFVFALIIYSNYQSFVRTQEVKFTVYDIYGRTAIDYLSGNLAFHFSDKELTDNMIQYNITPNRSATKNENIVDLTTIENHDDIVLTKKKNLFLFANKIFFIPQTRHELQKIPKEVDYLIVNHTRGLKQLKVADKTLVILTNNKYLNNWNINLPEHQLIRISKHGAYTKILNDV